MLVAHRLVRNGFTLDRESSTLITEGRASVLSARAFAILWCLTEADGERVARDTLVRAAWPGQRVADGSLRQAIWEIRQVLGEPLSARLESLRGTGYRLACAPAGEVSEQRALFGRSRELEQLQDDVETTLAGSGVTRLLSGPPGVGKSALADAALRHAEVRGMRVLTSGGACGPGAPALWPFVVMLSRLPAQLVAREQHVQRLLRVLTDPQPDTGWAEQAAEQRFLLFEELTRVFVRLAEKQPIVLWIDDLHDVDVTSLAFVARLASEVGRQRIVLLLATRPVPRRDNRELARTREQLRSLDPGVELPVEALDVANLGALLEAELGAGVQPERTASVHALTGGNPLFALQVVRHHGVRADLEASPAVEELIMKRLGALPEHVVRMLLVAAVWGESFSLQELVGVGGCSEQQAALALDQACAQGLVTHAPERARLDIAHPLMRRAVLRLASAPELARLHLDVARWLDTRGLVYARRRAHAIAYHASEAMPYGGAELTARYAMMAAEDAYAATAYDEAARLYALAIEAMDLCRACPETSRVRAQLALGDALRAAEADEARVRGVFVEAAAAAQTLGDAGLLAEAALGYAGQRVTDFTHGLLTLERDDVLIALLERALDAIAPGASRHRALLCAVLAYALTTTTQCLRRSEVSAESVSVARELGDDTLLAHVLFLRGLAWPAATSLQEQARTCDELVALTSRLGAARAELEARTQRMLLSITSADLAGVQRDLPRIRDIAGTLRTPEVESRAELWDLLSAFWDGQLERAFVLTQRSRENGRDRAVLQPLFQVRTASLVFLRFGVNRELRESAVSAAERYRGAYSRYAWLAVLHANLGEREAAREMFDLAAIDDFAAQPDGVMWLTDITSLAEAATRLGDVDRAALVYRRLVPFHDRIAICGGEGVVTGPVATFLGMLCATMMRFEEALRHFTRARTIASSFGMSSLEQLGAYEEALALLGRGTAQDRRRALRTAAALRRYAAEHDVPCVAQRAESLEARCAASPRTSVDGTLTLGQRSD